MIEWNKAHGFLHGLPSGELALVVNELQRAVQHNPQDLEQQRLLTMACTECDRRVHHNIGLWQHVVPD